MGQGSLAEDYRNFHRMLYTIILVQFGVIVTLLAGLSDEYLSNVNMQGWIATHAPLLGIILHGEVESGLVSAGVVTLLFTLRRHESIKTKRDSGTALDTLAINRRDLANMEAHGANVSSSNRETLSGGQEIGA